jgi:hypothetical protein
MTSVSIDSQNAWEVTTGDRPAGLEIVLLKHTLVLPWSQFLYAEGNDDEVRLCFSTHDIIVGGSHLRSLLAALSAQRVTLLREFIRANKFGSGSASDITSISVEKVE